MIKNVINIQNLHKEALKSIQENTNDNNLYLLEIYSLAHNLLNIVQLSYQNNL